MKPIVVPVNFTANSSNAARYAADMALAIEADLHLIHVMQIPVSVAEVPMPDYVYEQMELNAQASLKSLNEELEQLTRSQVKINTELMMGGVEYEIEKFCKRINPFVVVMGASGHSLENMFAGSNALTAVRHMPYPLLVVPGNASFHAIRKIVLACELGDIVSGMPVSVFFLKELRNLFGARFEVIHVATGKEDSEGEALFEFDNWKKQLQESFPELHFIRTEKVEEGVNKYLNTHDADWLMLFPKKHGLLEFHSSQSRKLANNCPVPVMSMHGTADADLTKAVSRTIKENTSIPDGELTITVEDGVVTLQGEIHWEYQRMAANAAVQILPGVRKVNDLILVKPLSSPAGH